MEVRIEQLPCEAQQVLLLEVYGSMIVAQGMVGVAQDVLRYDPEGLLPEGLDEGEGALAGGNGLVRGAYEDEMVGQKVRELS